MEEKIKIKPLTKQQIIISLDRLTRFKYTEDKYLRVFKDIISSNLINPKYKKKELDLMDYDKLTELAQNIFNFSLNALGLSFSGDTELQSKFDLKYKSSVGLTKGIAELKTKRMTLFFADSAHAEKIGNTLIATQYDFNINEKLLEYEKSIFTFDKRVEKLLKNKIDYKAALELIDGEIVNPPYKNLHLPLNLRWLKSLADDGHQVKNRKNLGLKFPLEKIVIAEGITEEILLPKFAKLCGYDFDKMGVHLISAGGKNQVVRIFYQLADILKLPIFALLDKDAGNNYQEIKPKLRNNDKVYVLEAGEFEDILPLNLIKRTLNRHFEDGFSVKLDDLRKSMPMTQILTEIFKERGQEFKKAEFALLLSENISDLKDVSDEIEKVVAALKTKDR